MKTRLEINFRRLLDQCKSMANDNQQSDWRFQKYVSTLDEYLADLKKSPSPPVNENMEEYTRVVQFLKGLILTEKLPTVSQKIVAHQLLAHGPAKATGDPLTQEIHHKVAARYHQELRDDLLHNKDEDIGNAGSASSVLLTATNGTQSQIDNSLRLRKKEDSNPSYAPDTKKNVDELLVHHQKQQERITEDMLLLARSLKEQSSLAGTIIRTDKEVLEKSNKLAETNKSSLATQAARLKEHSRWAFRWWLWIAIFLVCAAFLSMVMFMKLFKKRSA